MSKFERKSLQIERVAPRAEGILNSVDYTEFSMGVLISVLLMHNTQKHGAEILDIDRYAHLIYLPHSSIVAKDKQKL